jgi:phosphohistidine phosphatase
VDLYLVRHAIAEPRDLERWPDDSRRPLTAEGAERFRAAARGLRRLGVVPELVLSSSFARAWATAEILSEEAGWPNPGPSPLLEPPASAAECVTVIGTGDGSLALVGHQPQLSEIASLLLSGTEAALELELKKGGVVCLAVPDAPLPGTGLLRWSASPRMLRRLGR